MSITFWKTSSSSMMLTRSGPRANAALLTRISTLPSSSSVRSTIVWTSSRSLTSPISGSALRPSARIWSAVLSTSLQLTAFSSGGKVSGLRPVPVTTTSAPRPARATAHARPIPRSRPAPVMIATFPSSSPIWCVLLACRPCDSQETGQSISPGPDCVNGAAGCGVRARTKRCRNRMAIDEYGTCAHGI